MTCPQCGTNVEAGAAFCGECGATLLHDTREEPRASLDAPRAAVLDTVPGRPVSAALKAFGPAAPAAPVAPLAPPAGAPRDRRADTGTIVDGKYSIERVLGEGGMGVVYLATDVHTGTQVVLKAIRPELAHRADVRERTLAEGRALARIDHPNVVQLKAVVVEGDRLWLVMQYVEGESLEELILRHLEEGRTLPVSQALAIFRQVLAGMAAAHREGVIHRDLKPANILIRKKDGIAKVSDFGIAKGEDDARAGRGQTKGVVGSLWYMSPEQVTGKRDLDKRVDVYALGIVLFEMLTGRVPFDAESSYEIMRLHAQAPMPRVSEQRPDVPRGLDEIIQKACAKDRDRRFQTCEEFLDALERLDGGVGPTKTGTAEAPIEARPGGSRGWLVAAAVVLAAGAATLGLTAAGIMPLDVPGITPQPKKPTVPTARPAPTTTAPATTTADAAAAAPPSRPVIEALVGTWTTENGRLLEGVLVGDALELRVVKVEEFELQGYQAGEARVVLRPRASDPGTFDVEDRLRPLLPDGKRYESPNARSTCLALVTKAKGQPLEARLEGPDRLRIDFAKIEPRQNNFTFVGRRVESCVGLDKLAVSRVPVVLTR